MIVAHHEVLLLLDGTVLALAGASAVTLHARLTRHRGHAKRRFGPLRRR